MALRVHNSKMVTLLLLLVAGLLTGCGNDAAEDMTTPSKTEEKEILLNADSWKVMQGSAPTRATTYDDEEDLQTAGFKCAIYQDGTTTEFLGYTQVNWNSTAWVFSDGRHLWPESGNLDFFAYLPATKPTYVTSGPTYDVNTPSFVCTGLPITVTQGNDADTKEFLMAFTPDQSKAGQGTTGVTMKFLHPFARVCFKLSSASGTAVKVNSITISGDTYRNGTCTLNGAANPQTFTWSGHDNAGSFVISKGTGTGAVATGNDYFLVIPKDYGSKTLTVNATWSEWGDEVTADVSASVAFNWAAGTSYTYTLTLSKYALKVDTSSQYTEQW